METLSYRYREVVYLGTEKLSFRHKKLYVSLQKRYHLGTEKYVLPEKWKIYNIKNTKDLSN